MPMRVEEVDRRLVVLHGRRERRATDEVARAEGEGVRCAELLTLGEDRAGEVLAQRALAIGVDATVEVVEVEDVDGGGARGERSALHVGRCRRRGAGHRCRTSQDQAGRGGGELSAVLHVSSGGTIHAGQGPSNSTMLPHEIEQTHRVCITICEIEHAKQVGRRAFGVQTYDDGYAAPSPNSCRRRSRRTHLVGRGGAVRRGRRPPHHCARRALHPRGAGRARPRPQRRGARPAVRRRAVRRGPPAPSRHPAQRHRDRRGHVARARRRPREPDRSGRRRTPAGERHASRPHGIPAAVSRRPDTES